MRKIEKPISVIRIVVTTTLLTSVGIGLGSLTANSAEATFSEKKKVSQAPIKLQTNYSKFFFGYSLPLKSTGGSGSGKVTFQILYGSCAYKSGKLISLASSYHSCVVRVSKAGDSKYLPTTSANRTFVFDNLPGFYSFLDLGNYGIFNGSAQYIPFNEAPPSDYLSQIQVLTNKNGVRYSPYWASLNSFWSKVTSNLNLNIESLTKRVAAMKELGMPDDESEQWLSTSRDLLGIANQMKSSSYSNYLRDLGYKPY